MTSPELNVLPFADLGLEAPLLKTIAKQGYITPTPIQSKVIPLVLSGRDVMGLAQTGTGKTAAFGLPLTQQLLNAEHKPASKCVRALVLAPTRELVCQIADNMRDFVKGTPLSVNMVVGGASIQNQCKALARGSDVLIATPGRLLDLIKRKAVVLDKTQYLVLDEADQMLDLGFIHDLRRIAQLIGGARQTLLFSATMPKQISELSRVYLTDAVRVEMAPPGQAADKIRQSVHFMKQEDKANVLKVSLLEHPDDLSLVFARTKHGAEALMKKLVAAGFDAASIHGNKSHAQRSRVIRDFKDSKVKILVATDVAARGIDIPGVKYVYNYDLPHIAENYVHRIGRTARAGRKGHAISLCCGAEISFLRDIEKLMGIRIKVASGDEPQAETPVGQGAKGRKRPNRSGARRRQPNEDRTRAKTSGRKKASGKRKSSGPSKTHSAA